MYKSSIWGKWTWVKLKFGVFFICYVSGWWSVNSTTQRETKAGQIRDTQHRNLLQPSELCIAVSIRMLTCYNCWDFLCNAARTSKKNQNLSPARSLSSQMFVQLFISQPVMIPSYQTALQTTSCCFLCCWYRDDFLCCCSFTGLWIPLLKLRETLILPQHIIQRRPCSPPHYSHS